MGTLHPTKSSVYTKLTKRFLLIVKRLAYSYEYKETICVLIGTKENTGRFKNIAVAYLLYCCANFTTFIYIISAPTHTMPTDLILEAFAA